MKLDEFFAEHPKAALAFSGGTDSAFLLYAARSAGADVRPYLVKSQFQPEFEYEDAVRLSGELGAELRVVNADILQYDEVTANPGNRCYFCKKRIMGAIRAAAVADGYETVLTPGKLQTMTAQDYNLIEPETVPENAIGKLIRGTTWYYVTTLPASELKDVKEGARVQLLFARDVYDQLDMTVERVGNNEAGYKLLVLSCDKYMQNVTLLRQQSADVVFNSYQGLRVPKDAVRVEDGGQTGVYVLEGATARWKPITILHDNGESYVVELDKTSTANLWPGDEIIIHAKNLYDGKVVGK